MIYSFYQTKIIIEFKKHSEYTINRGNVLLFENEKKSFVRPHQIIEELEPRSSFCGRVVWKDFHWRVFAYIPNLQIQNK